MSKTNQESRQRRHGERIERFIFLIAAAFLLLVTGMLLARFERFPYPILDNAIVAARATAIQLGLIDDEETGADASDGERTGGEIGVTFHDTARAAGGFTVFTSGDNEAAYLISMDGRLRHRWSLPVTTLRNQYSDREIPDVPLGWRSTHLYPNGDLLVVLMHRKNTPYGFALAKIDKDSRLLWVNFQHAHHDVHVGEDGLIYTIGQEVREDAVRGLESLKPPFLEDFVLVLSADGQTVHHISIMEAFADTPFASAVRQLARVRDWKGDYFHVNAIEPFDSRNQTPVIRSNQVLISVRNIDALATLDLKTGKITWMLNGSWFKQHDPDIVDGRIMLFDNRGDFARGGRSRILEIDPLTQNIVWQASVGKDYDLYSGWGGSQQVLENGNVLVTLSAPGQLVELTREGGLAWQYQTSGSIEGQKFAPAIQEARRYAEQYVQFEFNQE